MHEIVESGLRVINKQQNYVSGTGEGVAPQNNKNPAPSYMQSNLALSKVKLEDQTDAVEHHAPLKRKL